MFFLIAHLVLVVQSRYAQIEKQTGRVVKSGGLLAIYIAFILVSGIMTGAGMDDYWRAEFDNKVKIVSSKDEGLFYSLRDKIVPCLPISNVDGAQLIIEYLK